MKNKFGIIVAVMLTLAIAASCKKNRTGKTSDSVVEITVVMKDGTPFAGAEVRVFDENGGFEENPFAEPLAVVGADASGKAAYVMKFSEWFVSSEQRYVTFAVVEGDMDNYSSASEGRTVKMGEKVQIVLNTEIQRGQDGTEHEKLVLEKGPDKQTYSLDEPLDLGGMELSCIDAQGRKTSIDLSSAEIGGFDSSVPSEHCNVTVSYKGMKVGFTVAVLPVRVSDGVLSEVLDGFDEIRLPENVVSVPDAFFECRNLKSIVLNEGLKSIGEMSFCNTGIEKIVFPSTLESIGRNAFYRCAALKSADMSRSSISVIPDAAFSQTGLENVEFPAGLLEIGPQAFMCTERLSSVRIPDGVRKVGREAFRESGLKEVSIPDNVFEIGGRAFYYCSNLEKVHTYGGSDRVPDSSVGASAFEGCVSLSEFHIPAGAEIIGQGIVGKNLLVKKLKIPAGVRKIDFGAFDNTGITEVEIEAVTPPAVTTYFGQWYGFPKHLTELRVPKGCAEVYERAEGWNFFSEVIVEK